MVPFCAPLFPETRKRRGFVSSACFRFQLASAPHESSPREALTASWKGKALRFLGIIDGKERKGFKMKKRWKVFVILGAVILTLGAGA
ncbi:MAG TPA: hypothetical protein DEA63_00505, partial [Firmicutes bacterium]|nr:hypothetical protein [Bacillota bacterium]